MAHDRCGAKTRGGGTCQQSAGFGTTHLGIGRCKFHGGAAPQNELRGRVELARREAAVMGRPLDVDPHEAILECIRITAGEVQYASQRIADLTDEDAVGPVVTTVERDSESDDGSYNQRTEGAPQLHVWIRARRESMAQLVEFSKVAISAGIAERQVAIAEAQGQLLANAIGNILTALGVADHPAAPTVVRRELTLVAGGHPAT